MFSILSVFKQSPRGTYTLLYSQSEYRTSCYIVGVEMSSSSSPAPNARDTANSIRYTLLLTNIVYFNHDLQSHMQI